MRQHPRSKRSASDRLRRSCEPVVLRARRARPEWAATGARGAFWLQLGTGIARMGYLRIDILIADAASQWLVRKAAQRLPRSKRERRLVEWLADLHDMPSAFAKLSWAVGCHWAATVANVHSWRAAVQKRERQEKRRRMAARVDRLKAAYSETPSALVHEIEILFPPEMMCAIELGAIKYGCSAEIYVQAMVQEALYIQSRKLVFARVKNTLLD